MLFLLVVAQEYSTRANDVYVIIGNSALIKCEIPSFVADFVSVHSWMTNEGDEFFTKNSISGTLKIQISSMGHTSLFGTKFNNLKIYLQLLLKIIKRDVMKSMSFWEIQLYSNVKFLVLSRILYP